MLAVNSETRPKIPLETLVIGYGNTLRGDDGIGVQVAQIVAQWKLPGVRSIYCHQLIPELAYEISQVNRLIFVDAYPASSTQEEVKIYSLEPSNATEIRSHFSEPSNLITLSEVLFGNCPQAWLVTIPGFNFDFCDHLSTSAKYSLSQALKLIDKLLVVKA